MFPIIPAKHPLRSSFHVTFLIRRSHWLLVHSDPLFPSSFLDSLHFRLCLSPSIFTHWTSSDTAFHFSLILPFSQKCRGERVVEWGREGLYGRPRPAPCAPTWRNAITLSARADHK